jgi:hypothetical protein
MNWPLVFIIGWTSLGLIVAGLLGLGERRRAERELAKFRQGLRETFESVCREMVREEREYRAKAEAAPWN